MRNQIDMQKLKKNQEYQFQSIVEILLLATKIK